MEYTVVSSKPISIKKKETTEIDILNSNDILYSNNNLPPSSPFTFTPPDDLFLKNIYLNYMSQIRKKN